MMAFPVVSLMLPLLQRNQKAKVARGSQSLVMSHIPLFLAFIALWLCADYNFGIAKTSTKELAPAGLAHKTRSARASASSGTLKPHMFLDIIEVSEEEHSAKENEDDEATGESLVAKENSNTSAESDHGNQEYPQASLGKDKNSGKEQSCKAAEDIDLDEVDGFLNDDFWWKQKIQRVAVSVEALSGVVPELPEDVAMGGNVLLADLVPLLEVLTLEEQAVVEEWASWHEALKKLKHSITHEARMLSLIEELIPSDEAFPSQVDFN